MIQFSHNLKLGVGRSGMEFKMKKVLLGLLIFNLLCGYIFSFDMSSIINILDMDLPIYRDPSDFHVINDIYSYQFSDDENEYFLRFRHNENRKAIECMAYVNNQNEAEELFNKLKIENTVPSDGRIINDTINEYIWQSGTILTWIRVFNSNMTRNGKYGVLLSFSRRNIFNKIENRIFSE